MKKLKRGENDALLGPVHTPLYLASTPHASAFGHPRQSSDVFALVESFPALNSTAGRPNGTSHTPGPPQWQSKAATKPSAPTQKVAGMLLSKSEP